MNWETYEKTTRDIYEALGKKTGVKVLCYGNSCKAEGKSGVKHQIDILTTHSDGIHEYKTCIECKYWKDKINKDIIMKVESIVNDCGFQKGIVVTKCGFTKDGKSYAKHANIGIVVLREPTEEDWDGRIKNIEINISSQTPEIVSLNIHAKEIWKTNANKIHIDIDPEKFNLIFDDGSQKKVSTIIHEMLEEDLTEEKHGDISDINPEKIERKTLNFEKDITLTNNVGERYALIDKIELSWKLRRTNEKIEIKGEDEVFLVMKSIFEETEFVVQKDKIIRPASIKSRQENTNQTFLEQLIGIMLDITTCTAI